MRRLEDRVALVTGAGSGIGKATAEALAREGASVVVTDVDGEAAAAVAGAVGGEPERLDVVSESDWERVTAGVLERHGQLDVVVNNAGVVMDGTISGTRLEDWRRVMGVNLGGVYLGTKHAILAMRKDGRQGGGGGSIVNVSSASGVKAQAGAAAYCTAKAGVLMLSRCAALECAAEGIRVNCVVPAAVRTPAWEKMPWWPEMERKHGGREGAWRALGEGSPMRRVASPEEVARVIVFLASDESSYMTGAEVAVDGGYLA